MIEREDERLLWKYLDKDIDGEEQNILLERLQSEPDLALYLDAIKEIENTLISQKSSQMSELLKASILGRIRRQQKYTLDTDNLNWRNLRSFAFFNLLLLGASILYLLKSSVASGYDRTIFSTISNTLDKPFFQTFFLIITAVLTLLIFDQYLKRKVHHGVNTPV